MRRSRRAQLWDRLAEGDLSNVGVVEFQRLIESFGSRLRQVSGSHYIYTHPKVPRPLSLQPRNREAKPYQIRAKMTHKYHINLFWSEPDGAWIADVPDLHSCSAFGDYPGRGAG